MEFGLTDAVRPGITTLCNLESGIFPRIATILADIVARGGEMDLENVKMQERSVLWGVDGLRAHTRARDPRLFFKQYLKPLLFWRTTDEGQKHRLQEFQ